MADLRQRTLVSVRATCDLEAKTRVFARSASAEFGVPFSFDRAEPSLTGAESLLGLLASDVAGLFSMVAKTRRLVVDRLEITAKAELDGSLRYLGVIGADGTPCYRSFQLKVFIDSPESLRELEDAWQEAVQRAPLLNTLSQATQVDIEMVLAD